MNAWTGTNQTTDHHKNAMLSGLVAGGLSAKNAYQHTGNGQLAARQAVKGAMIGYGGYLLLVFHLLVSFCLPVVIFLWAQMPMWESYKNSTDWYPENDIAITAGMRFQQSVMLVLAGLHVLVTLYAMWRWGLAALARAWDEIAARPYQNDPRADYRFEARSRDTSTFVLLANAVFLPWLVAFGGGVVACLVLGQTQFVYGIVCTAGLAAATYAIARILYGHYCPELYVPDMYPAPISRSERAAIRARRRGPNAAPRGMVKSLVVIGSGFVLLTLIKVGWLLLQVSINPYAL